MTQKDEKTDVGSTPKTWSEARLQSECFTWQYNTYPEERGCFFEVYNNTVDKVKGAIRKATGRVSGVSDTICLMRRKSYLIEFKIGKGQQSEDQKKWQNLMLYHGHSYVIIRYLDAFKLLYSDMRNGLITFDCEHYNRIVEQGLYNSELLD